MVGLIFNCLLNFGDSLSISKETLLSKCDTCRKQYHDSIVYPDEEFLQLFETLLRETNQDKSQLLEDFGKFIINNLITLGKNWKLIRTNWDAIDVLENVSYIHKSVLLYSNVGVAVPLVEGERLSDNSVKVVYSSQRGLANFFLGLIKGLEEVFQENLEINVVKLEPTEAEIIVKKLN